MPSSDDGKLYTFGRGEGFRLGHGSESNELIPRSISSLEDEVVIDVSAGEAHFAAVTTKGDVWTWGRNSSGQLGRDFSPLPQKVPNVSDIRSVSCGESHTLALKADGTVFSCGNGRSAALGHGDRVSTHGFQQIAGLSEKIAQVAAGEDFSLFLSRSGRVYACGASDFGQTGLGQAERYTLAPRELSGLAGVQAGGVATKCMHTLAYTNGRPRVFSWGLNQDGQLGLGDTATRSAPSEITGLSKWLSGGWAVKAVETGVGHSAAILESRESGGTKLFVFGNGRYGQIGNGGMAGSVAAFKTEPVEVGLPEEGRVISVALGKEHSLCVCRDK